MKALRRGVAASLLLLLVGQHAEAQTGPAIHFFTDVTATTSDETNAKSRFALGQYDMFVTGRLADRITFLGETVFEVDGDEFVVDVERVIIDFRLRKEFDIAVGKQHTPFGYWNTAYHHGAVLQPTIERPAMFLFEDDGGPLPVHTTGVTLRGEDIGPGHLAYDILIGNGIGSTPVEDNDNAKSLTLAAHSQVTSTFRLGASLYFDKIAAGTATLAGDVLAEQVRRTMVGGYIAWLDPRYELLAEYQRAINKTSTLGSQSSDLYYIYGGYRLGRVVPYVRFDRLRHPDLDPFFILDNLRELTLGGRIDLAASTALKFEYRHRKTNSAGTVNEAVMQIAVGF